VYLDVTGKCVVKYCGEACTVEFGNFLQKFKQTKSLTPMHKTYRRIKKPKDAYR
jgi:hypothetical protein